MRQLDIDASVLRELMEQYPLYQIAERYDCDVRRVAALAREYGFVSAFATRAATDAETATILRLADEGWSIRRIATHLGRCQDLVARRIAEPAPPIDPISEPPKRIEWPKRTTTPTDALLGRLYEDVDAEVILRECPPGRWPINGAALAAAGRWAAMSQSRSAADLCVDA